MFELLRKFSLFMLLFVVAMGSYLAAENATDWREPLWVQVYPINGDGRDRTADYIRSLQADDFEAIERFMLKHAERFSVRIDQPVKMILGDEIGELPPPLPAEPGPLSIAFWSLKTRWWASDVTSDHEGPRPDIRLFLVYFDPVARGTLSHSVGMQQGLIGIVNVFADRQQQETNNFVIAHEMLHTLGATDKYDYNGNMPLFPDGYADPERLPLYPQRKAEVMGGRIPLSASEAVIPDSLRDVTVGPATAQEIRWLD